MQPVTQTGPPTGAPGRAGLPGGATHMSVNYYDAAGRRRTAAKAVPVNEYGQVAAVEYRCRKTKAAKWYPSTTKIEPVCACCGVRMTQRPVKAASLLPWAEIWTAADRPLRPVWAFAGAAAVGYAVDAADIPALALAGAVPVAGWVSKRLAVSAGVAREVKLGHLEHEDPDGDKRLRAAIDRAARSVSYTVMGGLSALTFAAALGVDPATWPGRAAAVLLLTAWIVPAATWWRGNRNVEPAAPVAAAPRTRSDDEQAAADAARVWREDVAVEGTSLDVASWKRIPCGWQATIVASKKGALNALGGDFNRATVKRVAAAYDVPYSAITWVEPVDGTPNRAVLLVQPSNPLAAGQVWGGPGTVDMARGVAEAGRLIDGTDMVDTLYRYGWGAPSEIVLGTTGGGKSARARKKMIVERYATYEDATGTRRGTFITILHDPKRMESYAEFRDAIHAYGTTRDDAHIIVDALLRECLRRYDYLAGLEWTDGKGRVRRGGLAWNPLVHGPVISHYWDEFHQLTGDAEFVKKLEKLARLQRACAMRATVLSHMGTLGDTGSQALRDMMAGGRATLFRTTSSLNAGLVTGGQLNADPRVLPRLPGMCFVADGETAAIMGRESYIPGGEEPGNVYDWLFDDDNQPVGFPAVIPPETAEAFGVEFMEWAAAGRLPEGRTFWKPSTPATAAEKPKPTDVKCIDAVASALAGSSTPLDMNALEASFVVAAGGWSTRTIRDALKKLREQGLVFTSGSGPSTRHELTPQARADLERQLEDAAALAEETE